MAKSKGIWIEHNDSNLKSGVRCILVQSASPKVLEAYKRDLEHKTVGYVGDLQWLFMFLGDVFSTYAIKVSPNLEVKELYAYLGFKEVYVNGELSELWVPVWIDSDVTLPPTLSFAIAESNQLFINRAYVRNSYSVYRTNKYHRQLLLLKSSCSETSVSMYDTDHLNRVVLCNMLSNLKFKDKKDNNDRKIKPYVEDSKASSKGVCSNKGEWDFTASTVLEGGCLYTSSFHCSYELSVKLFDWYKVYVCGASDYFWQLGSPIFRDDIISLLSGLSSRNITSYLTLLWNTNYIGKVWCSKICHELHLNTSYRGVQSYQNIYRLALQHTLGHVKNKALYLYCTDKELLAKVFYYYNKRILKYKKEPVPIFVEPFASDKEFIEALHNVTANLGSRTVSGYEAMKYWLNRLNTEHKKYKGKLTDYINSL